MYPVSELYKEKIKENNRLFEAKIQIEHSNGTLNLSDKDLVLNTLQYTESSQAGEEFTIGSTVASDISFAILNKPEYEDIVFMGATIFVNIGLLVQEAIDAHFLQPSQPSKMKNTDDKWEYVPLGKFNIDDDNIQRNTVELKAIDNMIKLDKPYSLSKLSYPATLYQIYVNACNVCDVNVGTVDFINKNYVVENRPEGDYTFRDIIGYVAELAGCFAKCNRDGALELKWYEETGIRLEPSNRFNFKPSDDLVKIGGVMAEIDDTIYVAGNKDYAVDLTENPLLQGGYETIISNVYNAVKDYVFTPYTSDWQGNPAIQAGDIITQIDRDGKEYNTLITKSTYKYRGRSKLEAKGLPEISRGFKGSTSKKIAEIKRKVEKEVGDKLTTLEQLQLNNTELIANMLGGYVIDDYDDTLYIADNEDLDLATKVWKWGLGGFGYSATGKDGPYNTSITADGSIVAMLVAANIITANMVQTGILQSEDGNTWINLDNGTFNFKNLLKWYDNKLTFATPDDRIVIGEHQPNKYGMRILGADGVTVIIDEDGIIQTDTIQEADNVDATHPLKLKFYIDDDTISIRRVKLAFTLEKFRAYETGAEAGGAQVDLPLEYYEMFTSNHLQGYEPSYPYSHNHLMSHTHKLNLPEHTHDIVYGIYEGTAATEVKIKVNGIERLNNNGNGYTTDQESLDLTQWITTPGWHTIELASSQLGRINASIYIKSFVGV